jgi:hypothetical protein
MTARTFEISLHPGQAAVYNSPARFKVVAAGRRFGKSHYAAVVLGIEAMRNRNEAGYSLTPEHGVYYIAPTFDQAKRVMWPKLRAILGYASRGGYIVNENTNDGWIEVVGGRRIYIKGADNPDSLRGIALSYVVLDEYADMKANVWEEIIDPALIDVEGSALFIGTPKGKNHFYKLFMGALEKPINGQTGDNSNWADWEAFHFQSFDNPFLSEKEKKRMLTGGNKSREVIKQEIEASFISGGQKVLKAEWFPIIPGIGSFNEGSIYITVDLAGFSKEAGNKILRTDETAICTTYVTPDHWNVLDIVHGRWDVRETALQIVLACRKYSGARLGIESGALKNAVGPYLEDYMREYQRYINVEPLMHNQQKKTDRIAWALQGRAERQRIRLVKGDWNSWFLDQAADFPDPLAHDDGLDALAYTDQMATVSYMDESEITEWQPLDLESGY